MVTNRKQLLGFSGFLPSWQWERSGMKSQNARNRAYFEQEWRLNRLVILRGIGRQRNALKTQFEPLKAID